jgi:hypothetical protein
MPRSIGDAPAEITKVQSQFFQKQLAGEEGPSFETAKQLCDIMTEFSLLEPWKVLADGDLVLLQDPQSGDVCYCSVMGALGEVYSLHVYVGPESYRLFRKVAQGEPIMFGDFFASQRALSAESVRFSELTLPDRQLLHDVGHPPRKRVRAPIFRAFRPGYHPWYVTQQEATLLIRCLQAVITVCRTLPSDKSEYWPEEDVYPFLVPAGNEEGRRDYKIRMARTLEPPPAPVQVTPLNPAQIQKIRKENLPPGGVFEVDHFFSTAKIGGKNERKACLRVGMAADAATGIVFPPVLAKPEDATADILVTAIVKAMQTARCLPREVHVTHETSKLLLEPLATELGFAVRVRKSMAALELAKDHLLAMMGDPGPYLG